MTNLSAQVQARIETFTNDITALIREDALKQMSAAFGNRVLAGKPRAAAAAAPKARGGKRTAEDLATMGTAVSTWVEKNPGMGIEQIAKGIGEASRDLKLPIKKLIAEGVLKTKGQKRGTKYFVK